MRKLVFNLCICFFIFFVPMAHSQIQEIGSIDTPGSAYGIAISGNNGYIADRDSGLRIVDISNPNDPVEIGFWDSPGLANSVALQSDYAYLADGDSGFYIINIIDPGNPVNVGHCNTPGHATDVAVDGNYAYIADGVTGLRIINISDPFNPFEEGFHELNDIRFGHTRSIKLRDNYAFLIKDDAELFITVDITNPANPVMIGFCRISDPANCFGISGDYAYVGTDVWDIYLLNISNLQAPSIVSAWHINNQSGRGMICHDNFLFGSVIGSMYAWDISDPFNPDTVGGIECITNDIIIHMSQAYVAAGGNGLRIFDVSDIVGEPHQNVVYVPDDFQTIQAAINQAVDGDTIKVRAGIYNENIDYLGKNIAIIGNPGNPDAVTINGNGNGSVVKFQRGEQDALLSGFLITNGTGTVGQNGQLYGGGIFVTGFGSNQTRPTITFCNITKNSAYHGGGIGTQSSFAYTIVENCLIAHNFSTSGGGIAIDLFSSAELRDNLLRANTAITSGAGVYINSGTVDINGCEITNNYSQQAGGGIDCQTNSVVSVNNCTIFENTAANQAGGGIRLTESNLTMQNSILWTNRPQQLVFNQQYNVATISYSDVDGGEQGIELNNAGVVNWGEGNITSDPSFTFPMEYILNLRENSPCIDSGNPNSPLDPDETRADIGAYYFHQDILPDQFSVDENTVALWHFNENEGNIAYDATDNDYDLILQDGAGWSNPGRFGLSKSDLTDQNAKLNSNHVFGTGWDKLTLEAYIYPTQLPADDGHAHIITRYTYYQHNPAWDIAFVSTGRLLGSIYLSDNQSVSVQSDVGIIQTGQWYHVALTWSSGNPARIFVNDEIVGVGEIRNGTIRESTHPLTVGWYHDTGYGDFYFNGYMDEARISNIDRYPLNEENVHNVPDEFNTIQEAINAAVNGDTVIVSHGTYFENIDFVGKEIRVIGDPENPDQVIIDGNNQGTVVIFNQGETENCLLEGFTIQGGSGQWIDSIEDYAGGGIICDNSSPTLRNIIVCNNTIANRRAYNIGGGIALFANSSTLENIDIWGNTAGQGGGISMRGRCTTTLSNVIIHNNRAIIQENGWGSSGSGGGLCGAWNPILEDCVVFENTAERFGGGLFFDGGVTTIQNLTITGNTSPQGAGLWFQGTDASLLNIICYANDGNEIQFRDNYGAPTLTVNYSDIDGGVGAIIGNGDVTWGNGNIEVDPMFVNPENGDFHLTENSPCIDTGDPNSPQDPDETRADMGAYYFHHEAPPDNKHFVPGEFNTIQCLTSEH